MTDPRIAPVEDNLFSFYERLVEIPLFRRHPDEDVLAFHSDVAFPMFNGIALARFADEPAERARALVADFVATGLPWMWWLTPSTTSPELEAALEELGLLRDPCPGMYRDLGEPAYTAAPPGIEVRTTVDADAFVAVMLAGFELPDSLAAPMTTAMRHFPDTINVIASLDGRPVACGTAYLTDGTAGLYNIASVPEAPGRGAGYAVTASLLDLAAEAGADRAILHATEAGFPLYRRLGFVEVCQTPHFVWLPPD